MLTMHRSLGPKGQLVLPKDIRDHFGLRTGSEVSIEVRNEEIVLTPAIDPQRFLEEFLALGKKLKMKFTMEGIKKTIEEEYDER